MRQVLCVFILLVFSNITFAEESAMKQISEDVYVEKVYASWLGQCIGNFFGLQYENKYIEKIPETDIPREYIGWPLDKMKDLDGAFSDDDTDIEYMYMFMMEERGIEPTYRDIAERWIRHINFRIWVANYEARTLMSRGYLPPDTGRKELNRHWFQIDPQLVNEIWAVIAPGMVYYAAAKSDWAARVTNDDYGTHATIWYSAMYSAAFLESDTRKLYDIGLSHVPPGRFRDALILTRSLYREGKPWRETRRILKEVYYDFDPNREQSLPTAPQKSIWSATLNGAMGAIALLYGEGDFDETLFLSCMAGFDCDNQAATIAGLLAIAGGTNALPDKYLYPIKTWKKPFNDKYIMDSREGLPSGSITEIAQQTAKLGEQLIVEKGGRITKNQKGEKVYVINTTAAFQPPLELRVHPVHPLQLGQPTQIELSVIGGEAYLTDSGRYPGYDTIAAQQGTIHKNLSSIPGMEMTIIKQVPKRIGDKPSSILLITGKPTKAGNFTVTVKASARNTPEKQKEISIDIPVLDQNIALKAKRALSCVTEPTGSGSKDINVIRDGVLYSGGYDSFDGDNQAELDWYGYEWDTKHKVSQLLYTTGKRFKNGGWWESLDVEYLDENTKKWKSVTKLQISPDALVDWSWPYRRHSITFKPVTTKAIRIIGKPGGDSDFTSIAELEVYSKAVKLFYTPNLKK